MDDGGPRRKRQRGGTEADVLPPAPLRLVAADGSVVQAGRRAVFSCCKAMPCEQGGSGADALPGVSLPDWPADTVATLADFCQRWLNVCGREASLAIAWRKALRPRLDDAALFRLLRAARELEAAPLLRLCCADLAGDLRGLESAAIRARFGLRADLSDAQAEAARAEPHSTRPGEGAGSGRRAEASEAGLGGVETVEEVLAHLLRADGEDALREAKGASRAWCEASRRVLADERERRARAAALGLGVSLDELVGGGAT